jgi:hypothetical protein
VTDDPPPPRCETWKPPPNEERFRPSLAVAPLDQPRRQAPDPLAARRARAEHLCLWLACRRALRRSSRRCNGTNAVCVFEQADVTRPRLDAVRESSWPSGSTPGSLSDA